MTRTAFLRSVRQLVVAIAPAALVLGGPSGCAKDPGRRTSTATGGSTAGAAGSDAAGAGGHAGTGGIRTISKDCEGFVLEGLKYSPGGETLPNQCEPFDAFTNNPWAVRCIEAIPDFKSGYAGDEYCILPPPPDKGIQVGVHPQGRVVSRRGTAIHAIHGNAHSFRNFELHGI